MKWVKRVIIIFVVLIVLIVLGVFLSLDAIVKKSVEKVGPAITKVEVKLGAAHISPMSGSGELKKFFVGNPEGYKTGSAIQVGSVGVSVVPKSVFGDKVIIRYVKVEAPEITFEGSLAGNNISKILANVRGTQDKKPETKEEAKAQSRKLQVDDFLITNAKVHVSASVLGGQSATLTLPEIHLSNLGQGPEGITPAELSTKVMDLVTSETLKAVTSSLENMGKGAVGIIKNAGTNTVDKLQKGVGDFFKKK
ncbi:MAG TPA: hypothetical protein VGE41_00015 [Verrucomicrobiae bacterium]|jgi:hypothetical protein